MLVAKPFSFSTNCKLLEQAIKKATNATAASGVAYYFILSHKKRVSVVAMSGDTFVSIALHETTSDADGAFGFIPEFLIGLIKNRADLEFKFTGQVLEYKQTKGRYSGNLNIITPTSDQNSTFASFANAEDRETVAISPDLLSMIKEGLVATNVSDVYQNTTLLSFVTLDKLGKLNVSSFDSQHFGSFSLDTGMKKVEFKIALPTSHFSQIDSIAGGAEATFSVNSGSIRVSGKGFKVVLPATQAEDSHFTMVQMFMDSLTKSVYKCRYDSGQLLTITDNLFTLYNVNTAFALSAKAESNMLNISFTTPAGTASDALKVIVPKGGAAFKASVDPRLLKDILLLSKSLKTPELAINDKVISIRGTQDTAKVFLACARSE